MSGWSRWLCAAFAFAAAAALITARATRLTDVHLAAEGLTLVGHRQSAPGPGWKAWGIEYAEFDAFAAPCWFLHLPMGMVLPGAGCIACAAVLLAIGLWPTRRPRPGFEVLPSPTAQPSPKPGSPQERH